MQALNEQRLFLWGENNAKQQQTVLDIFNQQHDGIVLLRPQTAEGSTEQATVLYSNDAFSEIVQTKDANLGIDQPLLKIKVEEGVDQTMIQQFMTHKKHLYSIRNLLQERIEIVSNTMFSIERKRESLYFDSNLGRVSRENEIILCSLYCIGVS